MITFISIDPSLRNTALVYGEIEGDKITPKATFLVQTKKNSNKQVRVSSDLIIRGRDLMSKSVKWIEAMNPDVIFAETPSGSQSYNGAVSYAVSCMLIARLSPAAIEVTPTEVKKIMGMKGKVSKDVIINYVDQNYPNILPSKSDGSILKGEAEHIADAIVVAEAGIKTTQYLQVKHLLNNR